MCVCVWPTFPDSFPVIHTVVILVQTVTLNVAVNSHSKALLTIMVSNNFVELKGSVFKKFEKNNLFQMSCSGEEEKQGGREGGEEGREGGREFELQREKGEMKRVS